MFENVLEQEGPAHGLRAFVRTQLSKLERGSVTASSTSSPSPIQSPPPPPSTLAAMVHGALLGIALTTTVVAVTAFEVGVFRPWREENWPQGFAEGVRQEWESVKMDFKEVIGGTERARRRRRLNEHGEEVEEEEDEEAALVREVEEFELHERQVLEMRAQMAREFGGTSLDRASSSAVERSDTSAMRSRHQQQISEHHRRQQANFQAAKARKEAVGMRQRDTAVSVRSVHICVPGRRTDSEHVSSPHRPVPSAFRVAATPSSSTMQRKTRMLRTTVSAKSHLPRPTSRFPRTQQLQLSHPSPRRTPQVRSVLVPTPPSFLSP